MISKHKTVQITIYGVNKGNVEAPGVNLSGVSKRAMREFTESCGKHGSWSSVTSRNTKGGRAFNLLTVREYGSDKV